MKKEKWLVWTSVPWPDQPPEVCESLDDVVKFLKKFHKEFGFEVPTQTIMLKRIVFEEQNETVKQP